MLIAADTLLNYDLNETFLVQYCNGVLRALNQLPGLGQYGVVRAVAKVIESTALAPLLAQMKALYIYIYFALYIFTTFPYDKRYQQESLRWCGGFLGKSAFTGREMRLLEM